MNFYFDQSRLFKTMSIFEFKKFYKTSIVRNLRVDILNATPGTFHNCKTCLLTSLKIGGYITVPI